MPGRQPLKVSSPSWCRGCGTAHSGADTCPGAVKLDSLGETVWQSCFETIRGETTFLITRTEWAGRWCARIFAHPNIPWAIPGGGPAIKFISDDPQDCRDDALRFLLDFCKRKGYTELSAGPGSAEEGMPARVPQTIPLVWGMERPTTPGSSVNVSTNGMFVATELPPDPGTVVKIRLKLGALTLPLRGRVTWNRPVTDTDRNLQAGMGIHLLSPPSIYKSHIQKFA